MFGTKIRSWMEAHIARSRAKRKERKGQAAGTLQEHPTSRAFFDRALFGSSKTECNEILTNLPISPTHFPSDPDAPQYRQLQPQHLQANDPKHQQAQQYTNAGTNGKTVGTSAVNLSSPESAYSTGYSTDGTSPCATYAPEYYINVRTNGQVHQLQKSSAVDAVTQVRNAGRKDVHRIEHRDKVMNHENERLQLQESPDELMQCIQTFEQFPTKEEKKSLRDNYDSFVGAAKSNPEPVLIRPIIFKSERRLDNTGTYSISASRSRFLEQGNEYEHHPWRKPAPPTTTARPVVSSPKIQTNGQLMRKPYSTPVVTDCTSSAPSTGYPMQLFSPRRMPLVATTSTQVMPMNSPRQQRSRVRTNPWPSPAGGRMIVNGFVTGGQRPWGRQNQQQQQLYANGNYETYSCRQESLSVGRSPVNRSDWRVYHHQYNRTKQRSNSSNSSCSSRSRSCSFSSSADAASNPPSSPSSSDDITLNEVIGKFDENYLCEKETDIVSDHSGANLCDNSSSAANFSSDASVSSLDLLHLDGRVSGSSSRSTSRQRHLQGLSGRRQRRRKHRKSTDSREEEEREHREEVELLQEVLNRRLKKNNSEIVAQSNRALLERLLMKNASSGFEGRRAWSANPAPMRPTSASRSVGGTPICLRRKTNPRPGHILSPPSRSIFDRNHQIYPAESSTSLKNTSASELALIEADKEADLKYAQLIMEAERMLLNVQQQLEREESVNDSRRGSITSTATENSPSRYPRIQQNGTGLAPNKRVELIKNAELNIELALSKSRNSQPELSSGSIKDLLDHSSPKRLLQLQQKKMIEPVVAQAVASTQTTENSFANDFESYDANRSLMYKSPIQIVELNSTSEHYACPQSEPLKRKVYEGQEGNLKMLQQQRQAAPWLRNSDTDCAHDQQPPQLQSSSAASSYSQLRKHMLIETLQGLKQSLEDQSAALKLNCLRPL